MKKLISILFFLCLVKSVLGQVTVIKGPVNPVVISNSNITSFTAINTFDQDVVLEPHFKLINELGQEVYLATGKRFSIKAHSTININSSNNQLISENHIGKTGQLMKSQSKLPAGIYTACVELYSAQFEGAVSDCYEIEVEIIDNLMLVAPDDGDTIKTKYPILNWMHIQPFSMLKATESFNIIVCEKKEDQSKEQSIIENTPVFAKKGLNSHAVSYPPDAVKLESGKTYSWMVTKTNLENIIAETEVWQFTIDSIDLPKVTKYIVLENKPTSSVYILESNTIYFKFEEPYVGGSLRCVIVNDKGQNLNSGVDKDEQSISIKNNGYNRYQVNIDSIDLKAGIYKLIVENDKKEKYNLKFKVE